MMNYSNKSITIKKSGKVVVKTNRQKKTPQSLDNTKRAFRLKIENGEDVTTDKNYIYIMNNEPTMFKIIDEYCQIQINKYKELQAKKIPRETIIANFIQLCASTDRDYLKYTPNDLSIEDLVKLFEIHMNVDSKVISGIFTNLGTRILIKIDLAGKYANYLNERNINMCTIVTRKCAILRFWKNLRKSTLNSIDKRLNSEIVPHNNKKFIKGLSEECYKRIIAIRQYSILYNDFLIKAVKFQLADFIKSI